MRLWDRADVLTTIDMPDTSVVFDRIRKVAFIYSYDPDLRDDAYVALELHLSEMGYFTQVITAARNAHRGATEP
jgi:hypothetical protein